MRYSNFFLACRATIIAISLVVTCFAGEPAASDNAELPAGQKILELPVRVVDLDGKPIANVKITPWALRSSQGHGWWPKDDKLAGFGPKPVVTDAGGAAIVEYPFYRDAQEQTKTITVSVHVDHPDYAYIDGEHIDVPLLTKEPYEVKLTPGVQLELHPLIDGKPAELDNLYAVWSDGRSWQKDVAPTKTDNGTLRLPAMAPGKNSVLLVKLDGDHATHISKITDLDLKAGQLNVVDIPLRPSLRVAGKLSDNVPRPVKEGRLKARTLSPAEGDNDRATWWSWTPIQSDGTFVIDSWPVDEPIQLIALCDGYIADSGKVPDVVKDPPKPGNDFFCRPQVFQPQADESIEVAMIPLVRCQATVVDEGGTPLVGIKVVSWPNVGWWNNGSQIYCDSLVRSERLLHERDYMSAEDHDFSEPFEATTDASGKTILFLPHGKEYLSTKGDVYALPPFLGHRDVKVALHDGQTTEVTLQLEPCSTEKLGDWDKLAGVVFGCSTREGRQICALPGVRAKMDEFEKRFREAKDQHDPQLLSEAYAAVSDAFVDAGDLQEAEKWHHKADEQAAKAKAAKQSAPTDPAK